MKIFKKNVQQADSIVKDFTPGQLVIVASRSKPQKTDFLIQTVNIALENHRSVGFFSFELSRNQFIERWLALRTGIEWYKLREGYLDKTEFRKALQELKKMESLELFIDDSVALTIDVIAKRIRRLAECLTENGKQLKGVFIDSLSVSGNRQKHLWILKELAEKLEISILVGLKVGFKRNHLEKRRPFAMDNFGQNPPCIFPMADVIFLDE